MPPKKIDFKIEVCSVNSDVEWTICGKAEGFMVIYCSEKKYSSFQRAYTDALRFAKKHGLRVKQG